MDEDNFSRFTFLPIHVIHILMWKEDALSAQISEDKANMMVVSLHLSLHYSTPVISVAIMQS